MTKETLGAHNAIWDSGEWVSWSSINSHLEKLELQARHPNADVELVPIFEDLLSVAERYHYATGKHLKIYGDIGELFGAITFGIKLHKDNAKGSDGRLGDGFVEVKTISPFKKKASVSLRLDRHFSKLLVVKIDGDFEVAGRLIDRSKLPKVKGQSLQIEWDQLDHLC